MPQTSTTQSPSMNDAVRQLATVREYLRDLDAEPEVVYRAIQALSEDGLDSFGLRSFHMNLLAVFGDQWSPEKVRATAVKVARLKLWESWRYAREMCRLGHDRQQPSAEPRLRGFDPERLRQLRRAGRGLVVCTIHVGSYRHLPTDIALSEQPCVLLLDADAHAQSMSTLAASAEPRFESFIELVNVEAPSGSIKMVRALARRKIVFAYIDGNTGRDGPLGNESRTELDLLGYRVRMKNGLVRLAARFGCPVLPMLTPVRDGVAEVVTGEPIHPGGRLKGALQDQFVEQAMVELYHFFETGLLAWPEQWETACFFHRWRAGTQAVGPDQQKITEVRQHLEEQLAAGKRIRVNRRRIVPIRNGEETVWTDARTLKAFRAPADQTQVLERLSSGLDQTWLEQTGAGRDRALSFLAFLGAQEALTVDA